MKPCPKCGNPDDLELDSSDIANASWIECGWCEFRFQQECCEETLEKRWDKIDRSVMTTFVSEEKP